MEKFLKLLYYYCLGLFLSFVIYMAIVMFLSPRQDVKKRGFIPCTEELVYNLSGCESGKMSCTMGYLWDDMKCNVKVVLNGLGAWAKNEQSTPWANYLFEPVTQAEQDGVDFGSADGSALTEDFIKIRRQELEEAKNRSVELDESVLHEYPEIKDRKAPENVDFSDEAILTGYSDDIADETLIDELSVSADDKTVLNNRQQQSKDVLKNLREITDAKLKEGKTEDEK